MFRVWILPVLAVCLVVPFAQAKDVSMQQATYNNALQKLERSEVEYKADTQAVGDTEKLIEKKQKQLSEEKKKAEISRKNYLDAKESLERAQTVLDNAWKN
jgi:hypothetical protein